MKKFLKRLYICYKILTSDSSFENLNCYQKIFEDKLIDIRHTADFQASKQYHPKNITEPWKELRDEIDFFLSCVDVCK